jgi:ribosomal protein S18 acetylase RimI-like enzyme
MRTVPAEINVIPFDPKFANAFADLNYPWIEESYGIEPHDHEVLDHPAERVIEPGGEIFFALEGDEVVGTVAMIRMNEKHFELAKMAVSPKSRGRGIGDKLMQVCIDYGVKHGVKSIILESNTKQGAAIRLYRRFGFVEIPLDPDSPFVRANIRMELALNAPRL